VRSKPEHEHTPPPSEVILLLFMVKVALTIPSDSQYPRFHYQSDDKGYLNHRFLSQFD